MPLRSANATGLLALCLAACSSGVAKDPAQSLRDEVPASQTLLERGAGTAWSNDDSGHLIARASGEAHQDLPPGRKAASGSAPALSIALGQSYEEGYQVSLAGATAFSLRVTPLEGRGELQAGPDGLVRAAGVQRRVDSVFIASAGGLEELLLARDPSLRQVGYSLERGPGIAQIRVTESGYVEALDAQGRARLRSPIPTIIDAKGNRVQGAWALEGDELFARWSNEGLTFPIAVDPEWDSTAAMADARQSFSATLMPDATVLACGGTGGGTSTNSTNAPLKTCELFDSTSGTWTWVPSMNSARTLHSATPLPDGSVLVAGGISASASAGFATGTALSSLELYKNGAWTLAPGSAAMSAGRVSHTATLFFNAGAPMVLLAGGIQPVPGAAVYLASADIYDVTNLKITKTMSMQSARYQHTAARLASGDILIAGGLLAAFSQGSGAISRTADLFNATSMTFSAAAPMAAIHEAHSSTLLPGGSVLVAGGQSAGKPNATTYSEIYVPASNTWVDGGTMGTAHASGTATLLPSGRVAVYGGINANGVATNTDDIWSDGGVPFGWYYEPSAPYANAFHEAVLMPSGRVLMAGGTIDGGAVTSAVDFLNQNQGNFDGGAIFPSPISNPSVTQLPILPSAGPATLMGPPLLVVADYAGTDGGTLTSQAYLINENLALSAAQPTLAIAASATGPFPHLLTGHSATLLLDGRVLIAGGQGTAPTTGNPFAYSDCYLFDPAALTYTALANKMITARGGHTATLLPDGRVLVTGGVGSGYLGLTSTEIFDPTTQSWSAGPSLPTLRTNHTATLLPGGDVLIAGGYSAFGAVLQSLLFHYATNTLSQGAFVKYGRAYATANVLPSGEVLFSGGSCAYGTAGDCAIFNPPYEVYQPASSTFQPLAEYFPFTGHTTTLTSAGDLYLYGGSGSQFSNTSINIFTRVQGSANDIVDTTTYTGGYYGPASGLLPSGHIASVGGTNLNSYDPGRGISEPQRPVISIASNVLVAGQTVAITGTGLSGLSASEGSSGSTGNSPTAMPIVHLQRIDADDFHYLPLAKNTSYSATSVTSQLPSAINPGWYRLSVTASGIPSKPLYVQIGNGGVTTSVSAIAFGAVRTNTSATNTFTLTNSGSFAVTVGPFSSTAPFSISPSAATTLQPGGTLTLTATFTPVAVGSFSGVLSGSNASAGPVGFTGSGINSAPTLSPASLTLPSTVFGASSSIVASANNTLTLSNTGSATLTVTSASITSGINAGANDFSLVGPASATLSTGQSTSWIIVFTPSAHTLASAAEAAIFNVVTDNGAFHTALSGQSLMPVGAVTPGSFGSVNVGASATASFLVVNSGTSPLNVSSASFSGLNASDFSVTSVLPIAVGAGGNTNVTVRFAPTKTPAGPESATLTFASDSAAAVAPISLSGTGLLATAGASPALISFGSVRKLTTSAAQTIAVSNSGNVGFAITSTTITGPDVAAFTVSGAAGSTVNPGSSINVSVTFLPATSAAASATLNFVAASTGASPVAVSVPLVSLVGSGVFPSLSIQPSSLSFGTQGIGVASLPQLATITNLGTDTLNFSSSGPTQPTLSGATSADFSISPAANALPKTLAAGASTSFAITFAPTSTSPSARSASLSIPNNDGLAIAPVLLTGSALALGLGALQIPDTILGQSSSTTASASNTASITNSSSSALAISSASFTGANAADFFLAAGSPTSIAAGGTGSFIVVFRPVASGNASGTSPETATLNLITSAGTFTAAVASNSLYPVASVVAGTFATTAVGSTSAASTLVISNSGKAPLSVTALAISSASASDFAITSPATLPSSASPLSIAAGTSSNVGITFSPRAAASETAIFSIAGNGGAPFANLGGTGVALTPSSLQLPDTVLLTSSSSVSAVNNTVTLVNGGTTAITVSGTSFSGANASDFSVAAGGSSSIAAGATGKWIVVFTPLVNTNTAGKSFESATFSLATSAGNLTVPVSANSLYPVASAAYSGASNFPPTSVGSTSGTILTAVLKNNGAATLTFSGLSISGTDASDFSITSTVPTGGAPITLTAGASSSVTLAFKPGASPARPETALLMFTSDGGNPSLVLAGFGAQASASISPTSLTLVSASGGSVRKGAISASQTVTITNNGNVSMSVNGLSFIGQNPTDFTVSPTPSAGSPIPITSGAGNTQAFTVTFTPKTAGAEGATLSFTSAAGSPSVPSVALSGTGIFPVLSVQPTTVSFATQPKGTTSAPTNVVITNTGSDTLNISAIALSETTDFAVSAALPSLPFTLAVGASKTLGVQFAPKSAAALAGTLSVTSSDFPSTPASVAISGSSVLSSPVLTPSALALPDMAIGSASPASASAANTVTLSNSAGASLNVASISLSGANASDFSVAGGSSALSAGESATWVIVFKPTLAAAESATLTIATDNGSFSTALTGSGVNIVATPTSLQFVSQRKNVTSAAQSVSLSNTGLSLLNVAVTATLDFTATLASGNTLPIAAGKSVSWNVTFTPSTSSAETGTLSFTTNLGNSSVALSGNAIYPVLSVQPGIAAFGNQRVKTNSAALNVVLTNTGSDTLDLNAPALSDSADYSLSLADGGSLVSADGGASLVTLAGGASATLFLQFHPQATGAANGTISFASSDPGISAQNVSLSGNGTAPAPHLSTSALAFGNQIVGTVSAAQSVAVTNPSGVAVDTLDISGATVTSSGNAADAADFVVTAPSSGSITPGVAGASWSVVYQPSLPARAESATLTLLSDAGPLTIALTGTGLAALASTTPANLAFAAQPKGTSSRPQSFIINNAGTDALAISAYGLSGANVGDFAISSSPSSQVAPVSTSVQPGGSQRYYVVFTPSTLNGETASVTFQTSAGPASVALLGAGIGAALAFDPSSEDFGPMRVASAATAITAMVTNATSATITLNSFLLAGANASDFTAQLAAGKSFPLTLAAGGHAGVLLGFTPKAVGARSAALSLIGTEQGSDAGTSGVTLILSGTGISPTLDLSTIALDFSDVRAGSTAVSQAVTIANHGTADLLIQQLTISGPGAASFSIVAPAPTVPKTLATGATLTMMLEFAPTAVGSAQANLVVTTDDPLGATAQVALAGEGVSPNLSVSPLQLAFDAHRVGTASAPMSLLLTNSGSASASWSAATLSGTNAADFSLPGLPVLPTSLSSGAAQSLLVVFSPAAHGDRTASLTLNTELGPVIIPLTGSGLAAGIGVQPGSLDFGSVALGAEPTLLQLAIQNLGDAPLDLSLLAINGPGADSFRTTAVPDAGPLAPNAIATLRVEYAPKTAATDTAALHVTSPDPMTAGVDIALTGVAVTPRLTLSGPLTFTAQPIGTISLPQQVTITNTSAATLVLQSVSTTPGDFSAQIAGAPATVAPGGTAIAAVSFTPTRAGSIAGKMSVFVQGQATAIASTPLTGTGTTPGSGCGTLGKVGNAQGSAGTLFELAIFAAMALWLRWRNTKVGQLPQRQSPCAR